MNNFNFQVFGEDGTRLFDFWATEASLKINGDFLEPTSDVKLPYKVPRVHAARNIGADTYHEILLELPFLSLSKIPSMFEQILGKLYYLYFVDISLQILHYVSTTFRQNRIPVQITCELTLIVTTNIIPTISL